MPDDLHGRWVRPSGFPAVSPVVAALFVVVYVGVMVFLGVMLFWH